MNSRPFWIIWNPLNPSTPQHQYPSRASAQRVARAMAAKHSATGAYFYVMKAQSCHQMQGDMCDFILQQFGERTAGVAA